MEHLRREITLISLPLETRWALRAFTRQRRGSARARPEGRHTEIAELEAARCREEDVGGLEVEVEHAARVDEREALCVV